MGKILMKNFFSRIGNYIKSFFVKENFIRTDFDKKQKIQSLVTSLVMIALFVFASFTFFNMLYAFADILGSIVSGSPDVAIKDLLRSLPLFLSFFMSLWGMLLVHAFRKGVDDEYRLKSIFRKSIAVLSISGVCFLYVFIMRFAGKYSSLVEGSPSCLYPLDSVLFSLLYICMGVCGIIYVKRFKEKLPYTVPVRPVACSNKKPLRGLYCFGVSFWTLIALFGFAGAGYSLFIYDFKHEYVFFGIAMILIYILSPIMLAFWEFYFSELKEEKKKQFLLPVSIVSLVVSAIFLTLYMVSYSRDAQANAGFGMFPITFTANANYGTLLVIITPVIVSVVALIRGIIAKVKK